MTDIDTNPDCVAGFFGCSCAKNKVVEVRGPDDFETPESNEVPQETYAVSYLAEGDQRIDYYDSLEDAKEAISGRLVEEDRAEWEVSLLKAIPYTTKITREVVV